MGVFMIALEKLVCFCPIRPVFIAKLRLPIAYLYYQYVMVQTVKDCKKHSIRFVYGKSLNFPHYDGHFSNYEIQISSLRISSLPKSDGLFYSCSVGMILLGPHDSNTDHPKLIFRI